MHCSPFLPFSLPQARVLPGVALRAGVDTLCLLLLLDLRAAEQAAAFAATPNDVNADAVAPALQVRGG